MSSSLWPVKQSPPGSSVHGILQAGILQYFQYIGKLALLNNQDEWYILSAPEAAGEESVISLALNISFLVRLYSNAQVADSG